MPQEIEVKYLVKQPLIPLANHPQEKIRQGYVMTGTDGVVRIRQKGKGFYLTVKGSGMLQRNEVEIKLQKDQFESLWPLTEGKRVEKTRYKIKYGSHLIEVDVFEGKLEGLVVAEVEFKSEEEIKDFVPPDWFDKEVTWDSRYQNNNLAKDGMPKD